MTATPAPVSTSNPSASVPTTNGTNAAESTTNKTDTNPTPAAAVAAGAGARGDLNDPKTSYENAKKELIQAIQKKKHLDKQLVRSFRRYQRHESPAAFMRRYV